MPEGKIKLWFSNKGYGFIDRNGQTNLFFHITQWEGVDGNEPYLGAVVLFEEGQGRKGIEAKNVRLLDATSKATNAEINTELDMDDNNGNNHRFLNPYNFVYYIDHIIENHTLGKCPPPPHDRYIGITGRITCKVESITPLFVSDSQAIEEESGGHNIYRFFQYEGKPALPASSLRGMIRAVFEAVTNSCFVVFQKDEPYTLEHRESRAPDMIPARVLKLDEKGAQFELLDCTVNPPVSLQGGPALVRAGSVRGSYPPQVLSRRTNQTFTLAQSQLPNGAYDGMRVAALVTKVPVVHRSKRFRAFHAIQVVPENQHQSLKAFNHHIKVFGWLHLTGPNIENKHDERLFFRWDDNQPNPPIISQIPANYLCICSPIIIDEYNHHLDEYWVRLQKIVRALGNQRWPNSTNGVPHPSTFVQKDTKLKLGDLVYVKLNSQGAITMLRPISMPRIPYAYPRQNFLPEHLKCCKDYNALCPACRVFGWVNNEPRKNDKHVAYAGRLRFTHGKLICNKGSIPDTPLSILSNPKPTTTQFYLLNSNGQPDLFVDYDTPDAKLRGRKLYRHHGEEISDDYISLNRERNDQNRTVRGALKPGAQFEFTLDFENLAPLELGALIYALELEEGMFHKLGYAKPLGFGSIKVIENNVKKIDWMNRLNSLEPEAGWLPLDKMEFKNLFIREMNHTYGDEFINILDDLRTILSAPKGLPIHYPRPKSELKKDFPQFEWFVGNKKLRGNKEALELARNDKKGLPLIDKRGNKG